MRMREITLVTTKNLIFQRRWKRSYQCLYRLDSWIYGILTGMISTMTVLGIFLLIFVVKLDCLCAFSSSIKMAVECLVVLLLITIST